MEEIYHQPFHVKIKNPKIHFFLNRNTRELTLAPPYILMKYFMFRSKQTLLHHVRVRDLIQKLLHG